MNKHIFYIIISVFSVTFFPSCHIVTKTKKYENEGEAEKDRIKKYFKANYKPDFHEKFTGEIEIKTKGEITYVDLDSIFVRLDPEEKQLNEIIFSGLIPGNTLSNKLVDSIYVCCLEELTYLKSKKDQRRFKFLVFYQNFMNPSVFLIELTNKEANKKTEFNSFIKGAKLTFIQSPFLQI